MYSLYQRPEKRAPRWRLPLVLIVVCSLLGAGAWYGFKTYQDNPELAGFWQHSSTDVPVEQTAADKTETVVSKPKVSKPVHVDKDLFSFDMPSEWVEGTYDNTTYNVYTFIALGLASGGRSMKIYVDKIPATPLVNRMLTVQPQAISYRMAKYLASVTIVPTQQSPPANQPNRWSSKRTKALTLRVMLSTKLMA